jgi:hypothetical protein
MKMTNLEIYSNAQALNQAFENFNEYLPVKVNFFMQKNIKAIHALAADIEESRIEIIRKYGVLNEETNEFNVPAESIETANAELIDLFDIEQDVNIHPISLDAFGDIKLSTEQVQALMFMIEE